jgi:hypothetical protein
MLYYRVMVEGNVPVWNKGFYKTVIVSIDDTGCEEYLNQISAVFAAYERVAQRLSERGVEFKEMRVEDMVRIEPPTSASDLPESGFAFYPWTEECEQHFRECEERVFMDLEDYDVYYV